MMDFQNWSDSFDLIHIPTRGAIFTWDNGRSGRRHTQRRLDRSICNQMLLDSCSSISCYTILKTKSDHYHLLLNIKTDNLQFTSNFKILKAWTLHGDCKELISNCWNQNIVVYPLYILSTKLKNLKETLKQWNKDVFGNIHSFVSDAEKALQDIQIQIQLLGHTDLLMQEEKKARFTLDEALLRQETYWQEKVRVSWHLNGDRNSKYFHRVTKIKKQNKNHFIY